MDTRLAHPIEDASKYARSRQHAPVRNRLTRLIQSAAKEDPSVKSVGAARSFQLVKHISPALSREGPFPLTSADTLSTLDRIAVSSSDCDTIKQVSDRVDSYAIFQPRCECSKKIACFGVRPRCLNTRRWSVCHFSTRQSSRCTTTWDRLGWESELGRLATKTSNST